jgi:hypothetical protein
MFFVSAFSLLYLPFSFPHLCLRSPPRKPLLAGKCKTLIWGGFGVERDGFRGVRRKGHGFVESDLMIV